MYTSRPALITGCFHLWASAWRRRVGCTYPIQHFTKRDLVMYMSRPALILDDRARGRQHGGVQSGTPTQFGTSLRAAPRQILDARPRWRWHGGVEAGAPTQFGTSLKDPLVSLTFRDLGMHISRPASKFGCAHAMVLLRQRRVGCAPTNSMAWADVSQTLPTRRVYSLVAVVSITIK
ncbi:hypothetical protein DFH06DRAFT_1138521 [Mycena polygramma]|nr:hypothetical protein DFH06DRAFT_1138521 [Mycena polygramma]